MCIIKNSIKRFFVSDELVPIEELLNQKKEQVEQQYLLPIVGNTYWMIDAYGDVHRVQYRNDLLMNKMLHNCNLFPTKNDALEASFAAKNARIIVFNKLK